ncbi:MAG: hypothetical protein ABI645_08310 [Pseudomonadota bacterium]
MSAMFKAVVWKELRENLKWAVVVLLGMAAVLTYAIPSFSALLRRQGMDLNGISAVLEAATTIGGLLAGLLIGAAQTLVENRGDKWGFLTHRPISRSTLFWAKAAAGILLYAISTGLPVAAALFWIASPGYLPIPFDWRIALPATANLLCGLVFYFAGLLTGMRQARWYVSRTMGIGAAIGCLVLQLGTAVAFWQAVAICAAGLIIVGTAAWSTFVAGGHYDVQPRIGRVATGVSIGIGIMLVGWLALAMIIDRFALDGPQRDLRTTSYLVTNDGEIVKVTRDNIRVVGISDPEGRPLERYRTAEQLRGAGAFSATLLPGRLPTPSFRSIGQLFTPLRSTNGSGPLGWYYVDRLGLFAGCDSGSGKLIGWMGPDGFSLGESKPRRFAGRLKIGRSSSADLALLVFQDAVYRVDLDNRLVQVIFQREPAEALLDAGSSPLNVSTLASFGEMAQFDVISTTQRVIVQRRDGTKLLEVPQDAKALGYPVLQVSRALRAPGVPTFLWYQGNSTADHISEFNGEGAVVNSWTLPPTNRVPKESLTRIAVSSAMFPLMGKVFEFVGWEKRVESSLSGPAETTRWTVAILSALVSAAAVFLHGKSHAFPPGRLSVWTGIALLLGPLGYLMMLALIEWPARESCPACSRKRVVTREHCEHCGEPFAVPPKDGTEIFEPIRTHQHA